MLKEDVLPDIPMETLKEILPEDENLENLLNFNEFEWKEPEQKTKDVNTSTIQLTVTKEILERIPSIINDEEKKMELNRFSKLMNLSRNLHKQFGREC